MTAVMLLVGLAGFKIAIASGVPWGEHVWGGIHPAELTSNWRVASAVTAGILMAMTFVVLTRAGFTPMRADNRYVRVETWAIAGFMGLSAAGNLASQSAVEQQVFAPVTAILAVLIAIVALGKRTQGG